MKSLPILDVAGWAHHSWCGRATPARSERARAAAALHLFARFPTLAEAGAKQLPWFAAPLARPACGRLLRLCAALACARSLRLLVSAAAHTQFSGAVGLPPLARLQCHRRGQQPDLRLDSPVDFFNRRSLCIAGIALALRATSGHAQRLWMKVRLPCEYATAAAQWRLPFVSARAALELIGDALQLLDTERRPC
ncbi:MULTISPECIES: hypothetical protein [unclassified Caballeronia]|uniref:hypothetical protein n=1 Tax=unclassified Caballeronia TaxID=2646786 RepID=UPI001FD0751B|nr:MULTISPECIES: hypothetical protein [unclassified Caballeronia]MDR5775882.1 hypothetical protein [Caballeronia sp. LZ002]MDR5801976.1 hypothetical protein [Caballeronia sp. LZ001]MDR5851321.1 hypothetical protein [Caballeronia sp. LZ003]